MLNRSAAVAVVDRRYCGGQCDRYDARLHRLSVLVSWVEHGFARWQCLPAGRLLHTRQLVGLLRSTELASQRPAV